MKKIHWRYLLVKLISDKEVSESSFVSSINEVIKDFFGTIGMLQLPIKIIRYDPIRGEAVIKCRDEYVNKFRSVVVLLTQSSGQPIAAFVARSSGTIKALKRASDRVN